MNSNPAWVFARPFLACFSAMLVAACGGSDSGSVPSDSIAAPGSADIAAVPCARCRAGFITGVAAAGGLALADAQVLAWDASGASQRGRTDALGRFELPLGALAGAVIVQVTGQDAGLPLRLHTALRTNEVGRQYAAVTPLSELVVADALAGVPEVLREEARIDFNRLAGSALVDSERRVQARVRSVLAAAGVGSDTSVRTPLFDAPATLADLAPVSAQGAAALPRALAWLDLHVLTDGYLLRHAAQPDSQALRIVAAGADGSAALPAIEPAALSGLNAALEQARALTASLAELTAQFAAQRPDAASLQRFVAAGFVHDGLNAQQYIERVLLRADAPAVGGFSLVGARWGSPRLLQWRPDGATRWRFVVQAADGPASVEDLWFQAAGPALQWLGNGQGFAARLGWAASLGPKPMDAAAVRGQTGVVCSVIRVPDSLPAWDHCQADAASLGGSAIGLPGVLDYGVMQAEDFGLLGLFRSSQPGSTALERRTAYAAHSRLLAQPSAQVQRFVLMQVDARRADPRIQTLSFSPGAAASGANTLQWTLHRPQTLAGHPLLEHFTLDPSGGDDWHAVEPGRCKGTSLALAAESACAAAWAAVPDSGLWQVRARAADGSLLYEQTLRLPLSRPDPALLLQQRAEHFARWDLAQRGDLQPSLARVNGLGATAPPEGGDALWINWPWLAPGAPGLQARRLDVEWHRASPPPDAAQEVVRRVTWLRGAGGTLNLAVAGRAGWYGIWLSARLESSDAMGNLYWHTLSPANPH